MMQALRVNPKSESIWTEYFKLECLFLNQILERRALLGIGDEEQALALKGEVLKIVYRKASEAIPSSCSFRLGFVRVCEEFNHTASSEVSNAVVNFILEDVSTTFGGSEPSVWAELAKRVENNDEVEQIFETACAKHSNQGLWELRISRASHEKNFGKVHELCTKAKSLHLLSEKASVAWMEALQAAEPEMMTMTMTKKRRKTSNTEEDNSALLLLLKELNQLYPESGDLWRIRCGKDPSAVGLALECLSPVDSLPFWEIEIENDETKLFAALRALSRAEECSGLVEALVSRAMSQSKQPAEIVTEIEKKAINCIPIGCFHAEFENSNLSSIEKRKLFEQCVERYPSSVQSWNAFIEFEHSEKDPKRTRSVILRAMTAAPGMKQALKMGEESKQD